MEFIPRYDEDFYNCHAAHILSYLKFKEVPIEYLFYNCLENTEKVYQHFVSFNKNRWKYATLGAKTILSEIEWTGAKMHERVFQNFNVAEKTISELIDQGKVVFILADAFYFPHRKFAYQKLHDGHSFMLSGYDFSGDTKMWFVEDHARPDFHDYYENDIIEQAYNYHNDFFAQSIFYFDFQEDRIVNPSVDEIKESFMHWLDGYQDDFTLYSKVKTDLQNIEGCLNPQLLITGVVDAFFFISSSRKLFGRFLEHTNISNEVKNLVNEIVEGAYTVQKLVNNYHIFGKLNLPKISGICDELYEKELELFHRLHDLKKEKFEVIHFEKVV